MEATSVLKRGIQAGASVARLLVATACLGLGAAQAVTITVTGPKGAALNSSFTGFRYTVEEDATYDVKPDVTGLSGNQVTDPTLSLGFHTSHMKVVKVGKTTGNTVDVTLPDTTKRYFVSVMPNNDSFSTSATGYTMNGTAIPIGASTVSVPVNPLPFNTAQISVFVFEDNGPINGAADAPGEQEQALCGFEVQLFEAGGTYGASGGRVATDTFGNPLGTEYGPGGVDNIVKAGSNQMFSDRNGVVRVKNLSPAKYTIYSIAPHDMPSVQRCNFANADGTPSNIPIWVANEAARTRPDQMIWSSQYELPPDPNDGDKTKWHQTTTIEGTWGVDAWVKSGEPTFFKEFGPPGHHVWHGWVRRFKDTNVATGLTGSETVRGTVVNTHMKRPPGITFHSGAPITNCWVGINSVQAGVGLGQALYANACKTDGTFEISGLRSGQRYQLAVWDEALDNVIANYEFVATPALTANAAGLGNVPVFSWFSNLQGKIFYDNGVSNPGFPFDTAGNAKPGIPNATTNIRFRDGSIYASTVTDDEGNYEFAEVFPFFNWMVAELDFTRFKARGATIIPDDGGATVDPAGVLGVSNPGLWPKGTMTPQLQPDNGNKPFRIFGFENPDGTGAASPSSGNLLQTFQGFLGQTNIIHWGMSEYSPTVPTDHGGITGIVHYASTRAEFEPQFATAENNEPGIPGVEIRLYKLNSANNVMNPGGGIVTPRNAGRANVVRIVRSDDWNKSPPDGCVDTTPYKSPEDGTGVDLTGKCYDGMRIWNQVRDGVFDGGWAFTDYCPAGVDANDEEVCNPDPNWSATDGTGRATASDPAPLPPGRYMTEAVAPPGFEHQKEEDKNVDFGDLLTPGTLSNPASCLGSRAEAVDGEGNPVPLNVPAFLELFPDVSIPARFRDGRNADGSINPAARRPYCNKKLVVLAPGMNPFSDFHMFTKAPIAGHIVGMILDDLANEFDPNAPSFGEKYAPPFMPISIRDYAGNEINRVYSDRYGTYNAMVPSTFAYNVPLPSGVAPNMVNVCLNSPTMPDGTLDPHYNPQYTQYCYTFQYLPGKTTYLDTPVLPIAAFAGPSQYALDTEQPDKTPGIKQVVRIDGGADAGPWVPSTGTAQRIRIDSMGMTQVNNPAYEQTRVVGGTTAAPKNVTRDFGFGTTKGKVFIGGTEVATGNVTWSDTSITVNPRGGTPAALLSGTVVVQRADNGRKSTRGATLHVGTTNMPHGAPYVVSAGASIQEAIDNASDGDLILVGPGVYEEAPIVHKRVRVQGWGAPVTIINASMGADYLRQQAWREKICSLVGSVATPGAMSTALLAGQTLPADLNACLTGDTVDNAPLLFASEEASGFFVLEKPLAGNAARMANKPSLSNTGCNQYSGSNNSLTNCPVLALQIDGFTVTGADTGGGIVANGNATQLQISNNRITGNQGLYNGGIRIGHADLLNADLPVDSNNRLVDIHNNEILKNGNLSGEVTGGGGGVSIYTGSDGYRVADNYIAGNFSTGDGGGMVHFGKSGSYDILNSNNSNYINPDNRSTVLLVGLRFASTVSNNEFRFNQSFSQAKSVQGGGLAVMGVQDPSATGITLGTGSMTILNNTFQGNLAGAGDGGGIALVGVNGTETTALWLSWNQVDILNNIIVNNGAGMSGGGISLQDAAKVNIINNTVAMNDSYATAARAFQIALNGTDPNNLNLDQLSQSLPQDGAGITAYGHSPGLLARTATFTGTGLLAPTTKAKQFSDATITNSVVLGNRRYSWAVNNALPPGSQCAYNNNGSATAGGTVCFGLTQALTTDVGNDIAVRFGPVGATLSPTYSVFTQAIAGSNNKVGTVADFASAYQNGQNGALKQLVYALEQTVVIGGPVLEVQEPSTPTTAAAFDEGGNFIDLRFGPLTRGACNPLADWASATCTTGWTDFGTYNPTTTATTNAAATFGGGQTAVYLAWPDLARDRNGVCRLNGANCNNPLFVNFIRGALKQ